MSLQGLHFNIKIRLLNSFLSNLAGSMLFPFMTIYFAEKLGGSIAGMLMAGNVFVGLFVSFYGGYLSDKYGRKKVAVFGEVLRLAAFAVMALANSPWLDAPLLTFFAYTINTICWGLTGPAYEAMLIDVSTPENRKTVYSLQYWSNNFTSIVGGVVGAFLFRDYRFEMFAVLTAVQVVTTLLLVVLIQESLRQSAEEKEAARAVKKACKNGIVCEMMTNYRLVFKDRVFMTFVLASLLMLSVEFMNSSYNSVRLASEMPAQNILGFSFDGLNMVGFLSAENSLIVIFLTAVIAKWAARYNEGKVLSRATLVYVIGYAVLAVSNQPFVLLFFMVLATAGELLWVPIKQSMLADLAPETNRSAYMAVNGLVYRGAQLMASLSVVLGSVLPSWVMAGLFFSCGLAALVLLQKVRGEIQKEPELRVQVKHA